MNLFSFELNKTIVKNNGILLIILAVLIKMVTLGLEVRNSNNVPPENRAEYLSIVNPYSGKITKTVSSKIDNDYQQVNQANENLLKLRKRYNQGEITDEEYRQTSRELEKLVNNRELFLNFYSQFVYAQEEPEERYLLYSEGWNALLGRERVDWAFVLLVVLFSASIYGREYDTNMRSLLISTKRGDKPLIHAKIFSIFMAVILLSALSSALEYAFFQVKFGLPHSNFPLQSLPYFQNSSLNLSLGQTFLAISAYRVYGLLLLTGLTMFISVLSQNMIAALTTGLMSVIIPYALPVSSSVKYLLPSPLGFILGQGFFRGTEIDDLSQTQQVLFQEISSGTQLWLILAWFLALIFMLTVISRRFGDARRPRKGVLPVSVILLSILCFSGCTATDAIQATPDYNMRNNSQYTLVDDKVVTLYPTFLTEDLNTHTLGAVIHDPFLDRNYIDTHIASVYSRGGKLYYATKTDLQIRITEIDFNSWESKIIYSEDMPVDPSLLNEDLEVHSMFAGKKSLPFFVYENDLYMLSMADSELQRVHLPHGQKEVIIKNILGSGLAFNGEKIFYTSNIYKLRAYDLTTGKDESLGEMRAYNQIYVRGDLLYFSNLDKEGRVYVLDLNTWEQKEVLQIPTHNFACDDEYIYFLNSQDNDYLYRTDLKNGSPELLIPQSFGTNIQILEGTPYIYFRAAVPDDWHTETYRISKETWTYERIEAYDAYNQ